MVKGLLEAQRGEGSLFCYFPAQNTPSKSLKGSLRCEVPKKKKNSPLHTKGTVIRTVKKRRLNDERTQLMRYRADRTRGDEEVKSKEREKINILEGRFVGEGQRATESGREAPLVCSVILTGLIRQLHA